jgi:hypothetical protein
MDLGSFLMISVRSIFLAIFVLAVTSSTMVICALGSPAISTRLFGYFSLALVLVLLPMVTHYFNGCTLACSLDIAVQIKIMKEPSLVFLGLWFVIYLRLPPEKYMIVSWKKKEFEDLKSFLVSFRLYFIIVKVNSCMSTMYYLLLYKYMWY